ncbi:MAG: phosphoribosylformylglycinamidine synthase subunit PurL [Planctomycetota bacterium]|jgi:phosphoribosylformylglycinamidine synthase
MDAWRIEISVQPHLPDPHGETARAELAAAGLAGCGPVHARRGYLLGAGLSREQVAGFAADVLQDPIQERAEVYAPGRDVVVQGRRISILPLPGVTDPVAHSVQKALSDCGLPAVAAGTYRVYETDVGTCGAALTAAAERSLANPAIQQVLLDQVPAGLPGAGGAPDLGIQEVPLQEMSVDELTALSREACLALNDREMLTIQAHYRDLGRPPRRLELETLAQTWSEHCKHKTLTGRIHCDGVEIDNLLKTTIAHVTHELRRDFCVSVFKDNAGVIRFDDTDCVCIKVETHNHPSAIEPFGGAGTGVGGVIRDVLGTGRGARPIASTDVFCFAPPDLPDDKLPQGCIHPLRLLRGVVAGVRDYGNPMGIPTVNGAVHFDPDFVGNPLVYVGNVGILPRDKVHKQPRPGDVILTIGGRTGRDGIHGATFSSLELHTESETVSSGAVQIGDPITERKAMDCVLRIRDEDLLSAITDCGAGGFSSAVGEMAEGLGAEVELSKVPLKYQGLQPWEIWISEAQERMVLAIPPANLQRALAICAEEDCEATVIGAFNDSGQLVIKYDGVVRGDLDLRFLHEGLPEFTREATFKAPDLEDPELAPERDLRGALLAALADPNIASKEWIIRQYDHEVQAASARKPLCGTKRDGPADAAVLAPKLDSRRGIVLANGLNPRYGRIDPAAMAECALDEAMRNIVAAGGDPEYTAVLDNYCWGNTDRPEQLGALVRASFALRDLALAYHTPFVSGKDSLNNEFRDGDRTSAVPGCILITAMSVIADVTRTLTSDLRATGNLLVLVGTTRRELGGSVYWKQKGELGASVPRVDAEHGKAVLDAVHRAIEAHCVVAAHDLSEGGLAVAAAEMAMAGRLGVTIDLDRVPRKGVTRPEEILFSESQSRLLLEVPGDRLDDLMLNLEGLLEDGAFAVIGEVQAAPEMVATSTGNELLRVGLDDLLRAFKQPLDLDGTLVAEGSP